MRARWTRALVAGLAATVALAGAACSSDDTAKTDGSGKPSGEITVFAAASLTESFTQIGKDFQAANPGTKVTFSFGASSAWRSRSTPAPPPTCSPRRARRA